ncbi:hypothetical protein AX16_004061 [Volvariella volvacea WC 439]|nr:hypothetical protein AX16_004061 [Volvariella volvacea WC 439]
MLLCEHRLANLPNHLRLFVQIRLATTGANLNAGTHAYPYPTHSRPTPHQIFHLPHNATQREIKARYYDLVRVHHPDSPHCRSLSPEVRHARFQSITAAYDVLRGKTRAQSMKDPYMEEVERRKRAYYARHNRRAEYAHYTKHDWSASADDRWKDKLILVVGVFTLAAGLAPGLFVMPNRVEKAHKAAAASLSQARDDARMVGEEQRMGIRRRVNEMKAQQEQAEDGED